MLGRPEPVDKEVAAATFKAHLDDVWSPSGIAKEDRWGRFELDPMHTIVVMWAVRSDGTKEHYFIRLGAEYYDRWPPTVAFVEPQHWQQVNSMGRWWPQVNCPPWLGLHLKHPSLQGQLICFSFTAEYYMVDHNPNEEAVWKPGTHTLAGTLARLQEALRAPCYQQPSS
jgi:hypothetical protein